jgi:hypothetical protein
VVKFLPLDPRFAGSDPAEDDGFSRAIKFAARLRSHFMRFYNMLKIPAEYVRDILSEKSNDISHQLSDSLLGASAATRELWWMNQA